jgi:asparagine synthase (glutamine-hydrolysing)
MSAVAAILSFDDRPSLHGDLVAMTHAMRNRGPHGIRHWIAQPVAMGHCALDATGQALAEVQPALNPNKTIAVILDGRIYNREEVRRALAMPSSDFIDRSDADVVLLAYEAWGDTCPSRLIGEYVFVVWDANARRIFAARDPAGTRTLYYHRDQGAFACASEIKALLTLPKLVRRLNEERVLDFLVVQFDRDDEVGTFFSGISRLPAGHSLSISSTGLRTWRHWDPAHLPEVRFSSMEECAEAFLAQLRVAIRCRLPPRGSVGAMLSGGLDSSSLVALIRTEFASAIDGPLRTFSLIREDRSNCTDWHHIQEVLQMGGLDSTIIASDAGKQMCASFIDQIGELDEPFGLSQGLTGALIYDAAAKKGCRVILDGFAGDLLFYSPNESLQRVFERRMFKQLLPMADAYRRHDCGSIWPWVARRALRALTPEPLLSVYRRARRGSVVMHPRPSNVAGDLLGFLDSGVARRYLDSKQRAGELGARTAPRGEPAVLARHFTCGNLSHAHELHSQLALSRGIEPRSPLSDQRLIELAVQLPAEAKLAAPWYKHLLRQSMGGILPEPVRWRADIGGHPGWRSFDSFAQEAATSHSQFWQASGQFASIQRWIDPNSFQAGHRFFQETGEHQMGFNLLALAILTRWLHVQAEGGLLVA